MKSNIFYGRSFWCNVAYSQNLVIKHLCENYTPRVFKLCTRITSIEFYYSIPVSMTLAYLSMSQESEVTTESCIFLLWMRVDWWAFAPLVVCTIRRAPWACSVFKTNTYPVFRYLYMNTFFVRINIDLWLQIMKYTSINASLINAILLLIRYMRCGTCQKNRIECCFDWTVWVFCYCSFSNDCL